MRENREKKRPLIWGFMLLCLMAGLFVLAGCGSEKQAAPEPMRARFYPGQAADGRSGAEYTGIVRSYYEAKLGFQTSGKIVARHVERGQLVHAGDVLVVLDPRDLQQALRNAEGQLAASRAQLELAEKGLQRYGYLYGVGAVSQETYDQVQQQQASAAAAVEQGEAQVAQSRNQLVYGQLVADRDGVVTSVQAEPGQYVTTGESVVTLADPQTLEVEFAVPERDMGRLQLQDTVTARFWGLSGQTISVVIREISQMADADTQTFKVRAALAEVPAGLRLGMSAAVVLPAANQAVLQVPLAAVFERDNVKGVWREQEGTVHFTPVVLGTLFGKQVEIRSGLAPGDRIVAAGVEKLQEGIPVKGEDF